MLPLALIAAASGVGRGILGAVLGNQQKQRNKGYIGQASRLATQQLGRRQALTREMELESMGQRGLLGGGSNAIRASIMGGVPGLSYGRANDIASGDSADTEKQFALESTDLANQTKRALEDNKYNYYNTLAGLPGQAIDTAMSVYSMGKDLGALRGGGEPGAVDVSGAQDYVSGINTSGVDTTSAFAPSRLSDDDVLSGTSFNNIHPTSPLSEPSSAWHPSNSRIHQVIGFGQPNYGIG